MKLRKSENPYLICIGIGVLFGFGLSCYLNLFTILDKWWTAHNMDWKMDLIMYCAVALVVLAIIIHKRKGQL